MRTETAQVVVVGSGMGGGTAAWALARRGLDVLVLERGEAIPKEPANTSPREVFIGRRYKPAETWRDGRTGRAFHPGVHYVVGGNTKVYGASLPRFRESDFSRVEHHEGVSPAWPFTYADLEPYYQQAEALYRVHGATGADPSEPWRSAPYPYPAVPHEAYVADLADRLGAAGVSPAPTSMGIDLRPSGACIRCATCDGFPCAVDAKSDAETRAIRPALDTGRARLLTGTRVRRIVTGSSPRVVSHLEADGPEGRVRIVADRFVVAAGAANSAALLLTSATPDHPGGLANSSDRVGRNFMMHNNAHIACMDLDRRNDVVFQKTLQVNDWYHDGGDGKPLGTLQLLGKVQGIMMKSWATKVPLAALDLFAARSIEWLVMTEDLPSPDNRVTLAPDGTITVSRTAVGTSTHRILLRRAKRLMRRVGYDVIGVQPFDISMNSHMCGTVVAGTDPTTSVLDPWCRAHDLENLWVLDSGFFPSSAAMNPALTIAAQALRAVAESPLGS
jgi:choline dehydrogenase-like flavoprotein